MAKNYDNLVVKLYHETDNDIIDFLEEKDANTFVTKEALRMFIKNYRMMENMSIGGIVQQAAINTPAPPPAPVPAQKAPSQIGDVFRKKQQAEDIIRK